MLGTNPVWRHASGAKTLKEKSQLIVSAEALQDHPIASIFPLLNAQELAELAEDIRVNGMQIPIVLYEGKILDGRNRYRAAVMVGAHIPQTYYTGESPTGHVISLNLKRRQLTASQRAAVAAEALPHFEAEAKKRQGARTDITAKLPECSTGESREKAAEATGASPRYVQEAKALRETAPEVFQQVLSGEKSIPEAKREVQASQAEPDTDDSELPPFPCDGIKYAVKAIEALKRIQADDSYRREAFALVQCYLKAHWDDDKPMEVVERAFHYERAREFEGAAECWSEAGRPKDAARCSKKSKIERREIEPPMFFEEETK